MYMTAWTDFVKKYAAEKGISYKAALSQASEPYKNRGTTQVKRNVAQRGLADIASIAKKDVETKAKEVLLSTTEGYYGASPELVNDYMYYQPILRALDILEIAYRTTPDDIKKEIDKIEEVNEQFLNFFKKRNAPTIKRLVLSKFPGVDLKQFDYLINRYGRRLDIYDDEPKFYGLDEMFGIRESSGEAVDIRKPKVTLRKLKKFRSELTKLFKEYNDELKSSPVTLANMTQWKQGVDNRKMYRKEEAELAKKRAKRPPAQYPFFYADEIEDFE